MKDFFISGDKASSIWNVAHLRNPNFTGRERELAELRASLIAGETAAFAAAQAIHGLGGVGKTQLAAEYAYRHGAEYDVVWWVRSEEPATLASDYAGLASRLDLPEKDTAEQRIIVQAVKEWLAENRRWLLVFDNAEDAQTVRDYLPQSSSGHIIVTSRNPDWTGVARPLSVEALPIEKAIEFLLKRTSQQDETTAGRLAEALGCLPLALELAGAYLCQQGCTIEYYVKLFDIHKHEMIAPARRSTECPDTVATTFSISFRHIESDNVPAAELLRLCAFLAPEAIPIKLLVEGAHAMPGPVALTASDDLLRDEALFALSNYSLIELDDETISIHRLVQAVARDGMDRDFRKLRAVVAAHLVSASFPNKSDDSPTWQACSSLLGHAFAVLTHAEDCQFVSNTTARLTNEIGSYLNARGEYAQAQRMFERALAAYETTFDADQRNIAIVLGNLGYVLKHQGDLIGATAFYERALATDEARLGSDVPEVAVDLHSLGRLLAEQGDLDRARAVLERALAINETALGPDHQSVAKVASSLAEVLKDQGDLAGAKGLYERALAIDEATLGADDPRVAIDLQHLAHLFIQLEAFDNAKALLERGLAIDEAAFGPDSPAVAGFSIGLGLVLRELGDLEGAKTFHRRALAINEPAVGPDHPYIAMSLSDLAVVLRDEGDLDEAQPLLERALAIDEAALGPNHPTVALRLNNLANVLREQGKVEEAHWLFIRALAINEASFGPDDQTVVVGLGNISAVLRDQGDRAGARRLLERVLAIDEARLGPDHPDYAIDLNNLGWLLRDEGDLAGAKVLLERSVQMLKESLGENHPDTMRLEKQMKHIEKELNSEPDESS